MWLRSALEAGPGDEDASTDAANAETVDRSTHSYPRTLNSRTVSPDCTCRSRHPGEISKSPRRVGAWEPGPECFVAYLAGEGHALAGADEAAP
jgi:hypothetical protein